MISRLRMIRFAFAVLVLSLAIAPPIARAQEAAPDVDPLERLAGLAELWATVKYFHPSLADRAVDWDSALVATIPQVEAATDSASYAAAVQTMLDALGDPATRIVEAEPPPMMPPVDLDPLTRWAADSLLILTLNPNTLGGDFWGAINRLRSLAPHVRKAAGLLFDLRADQPAQGIDFYLQISGLDATLAAMPLVTPGQRRRLHMGYPPQQGGSSGGYYTGFTTSNGRYVAPGDDAVEAPMVFLVNEHGGVPALALALQEAGGAAIVSAGTVTDAALVETHIQEMPGGVQAAVRLGVLAYPDGTTGFEPTLSVPDAEALARSLALLQNTETPPAPRRPRLASALAPPDPAYAEPAYPSREYRALAAFRIWAVIHYFFPYLDLMDDDWDAVFRAYLPRLLEADDAEAYHLAVAEMYAHICDTHGFLRSAVVTEHLGEAGTPLYLRWIEGAPVVAGFYDKEAGRATGIEIGDVILEVDGEAAVERVHYNAKYIAASTPQALMSRAVGTLLRGAGGSTATLTVQRWNGQTRTVEVPRGRTNRQGFTYRTDEVVRILDGNIGYADLDRLTPQQVAPMFEQFKDTDTIIFDMRGYPNGTAWTIAPYLAEEPRADAARFDRPMVMGPGRSGRQQYTFIQRIPPPGPHVQRYRGRTVMLIDERTISQAEHTGLFFEAANGTVFIGTHTNGANGDVTNFSVPGGISLSFTGQSVRHADGRPLQRLGLVPHVEVRPTVEGLRTGQDEVLEAALDYLTRTSDQ